MAALSPVLFSTRSNSAQDDNTAMDSRAFIEEESESPDRWVDHELRHDGRDARAAHWPRRLDTPNYSHRAPAPPHALRYGNAFPYRAVALERSFEDNHSLLARERRYDDDRRHLAPTPFLLGETRARALPREDLVQRRDKHDDEEVILRRHPPRGSHRHYAGVRDLGREEFDYAQNHDERFDARRFLSSRDQPRLHDETGLARETPIHFRGSYFSRGSEYDARASELQETLAHERQAAPAVVQRLPSLAGRNEMPSSRLNESHSSIHATSDKLMSMAALHRTSSEPAIPAPRRAGGEYNIHLQRRAVEDSPSLHRLAHNHQLTRSTTWSPSTGAGSPSVRVRTASEDSFSESKATNAVAELSQRKKKKRKVRICTTPGCDKLVVDHGVCIRHGGGKRCNVEGCECRAQNKGLCWKHGGYTICQVDGCAKRAKSRGMCWSHGGGTQCKTEGCEKIAVSRGRCWAHGGGKRCKIPECQKPAALRLDDFCTEHYAAYQATMRGRTESRHSVGSNRYT